MFYFLPFNFNVHVTFFLIKKKIGYLPTPIVILAAIAVSLGIVFLIVLTSMVILYFKRQRESKINPETNPSTFYGKAPRDPQSILATLQDPSRGISGDVTSNNEKSPITESFKFNTTAPENVEYDASNDIIYQPGYDEVSAIPPVPRSKSQELTTNDYYPQSPKNLDFHSCPGTRHSSIPVTQRFVDENGYFLPSRATTKEFASLRASKIEDPKVLVAASVPVASAAERELPSLPSYVKEENKKEEEETMSLSAKRNSFDSVNLLNQDATGDQSQKNRVRRATDPQNTTFTHNSSHASAAALSTRSMILSHIRDPNSELPSYLAHYPPTQSLSADPDIVNWTTAPSVSVAIAQFEPIVPFTERESIITTTSDQRSSGTRSQYQASLSSVAWPYDLDYLYDPDNESPSPENNDSNMETYPDATNNTDSYNEMTDNYNDMTDTYYDNAELDKGKDEEEDDEEEREEEYKEEKGEEDEVIMLYKTGSEFEVEEVSESKSVDESIQNDNQKQSKERHQSIHHVNADVISPNTFRLSDTGSLPAMDPVSTPFDSKQQQKDLPQSPTDLSSIRWKVANIGSSIETAYTPALIEPASASVTRRSAAEREEDKVKNRKSRLESFLNPKSPLRTSTAVITRSISVKKSSNTEEGSDSSDSLMDVKYIQQEVSGLDYEDDDDDDEDEGKDESDDINSVTDDNGNQDEGVLEEIITSIEGEAKEKEDKQITEETNVDHTESQRQSVDESSNKILIEQSDSKHIVQERLFNREKSRSSIFTTRRSKYNSDFKSVAATAFSNNTKSEPASEDNPHLYYAKFDFYAREHGELGFKKNDTIIVVDASDDIWWMGYKSDGKCL